LLFGAIQQVVYQLLGKLVRLEHLLDAKQSKFIHILLQHVEVIFLPPRRLDYPGLANHHLHFAD